MKQYIYVLFIGLVLMGCARPKPDLEASLKTRPVNYDSDDPAIWFNREQPENSIVFGTDKDTNGAIYAFDLQGEVLEDKTIRGVKRPNNVDISTDFLLNDTLLTDILVFTEREAKMVRVFSVPDMKPLDNGGFPVFPDAEHPDHELPMGIALYRSPVTGEHYFIVGRKNGPRNGYLQQYRLTADGGGVQAELVRSFGAFSGRKEIEAIAVDAELGYVYYADEGYGIRKYHAEPTMGDKELANFGMEYFREDIEGIAIIKGDDNEGMIIVSDQQKGQFNLFDRKSNQFLGSLDLGTTETDGCEALNVNFGASFPNGLFVAMSNDKRYYYFDLESIISKL